jgi:hypothetical protein
MARIIQPLEDVMSFLKTFEELFGEDYKKKKQVRIWWG